MNKSMKTVAALQVLRLTPHIREYLEKNDPQALAQADAAFNPKSERLNRYKEYIFKKAAGEFLVQYAQGTQFAGVHRFFTLKQANEFIDKYLDQAQPQVWK